MKILITHPFSWPYVRRGSERFLVELARYLTSRGHEITVVTTKPNGDRDEVTQEDGVVWVRKPELRSRVLRWLRIGTEQTFFLQCLPFLIKGKFDLVYCLYFKDGCAATLASFFTGTPYIVHFTGLPIRKFLLRHPMEYAMLKIAMSRASTVIVSSEAAATAFKEGFTNRVTMLVPPSDVKRFQLTVGRDLARPRILGVGAFNERRKGCRVLMSAFVQLKAIVPEAILQYSGFMPDDVRKELLEMAGSEIAADVEFLGVGNIDDLPRLYGQAAVTVLPSLFDVIGLVLIESLASGTPVVGTRHGGIPEVIKDGIGCLFEPGSTEIEATNAQGLCEAILQVLQSYRDPGLPVRCRKFAENFGWDVVGPDYEALFEEVVSSYGELQDVPKTEA